MSDDSHSSALPDDLGKPTRGDLRKLAHWIDDLADESAPDRSPLSAERRRLLLKGRSKRSQQIFRDFDRWLEVRSQKAQAEAEAQEIAKKEAATSAPPKNSPIPERVAVLAPGLKHIHVIRYDLRAVPASFEVADTSSSVTWESFAAVDRATPVIRSPDDTFFTLFDQLARSTPAPETTHTLFLEANASPNEAFAEALRETLAPVTLLRTAEHPVYERDQLQRWFAFHQTFPGILVANNILESRRSDWARLWHLAPWSWALHHLEELDQTAEIVLDHTPHDYNLSIVYRHWLETHRPDTLVELREPLAEWGSLLHDLVAGVVAEHPTYFEANAAYLAATAATGVRR